MHAIEGTEEQLSFFMIRIPFSKGLNFSRPFPNAGRIVRFVKKGHWEAYGEDYRIASQDFILAETEKPFRFIVKQKKETL